MTPQMSEQIKIINALAEIAHVTLRLHRFRDMVYANIAMHDFLTAIISAPNSIYRGCTFEIYRDDPKINIEIGFPDIEYTKTRGIELIK